MNARTRAALPIEIFAALLVVALLLLVALPAMAQAQEETPTPDPQSQEPAQAQEETQPSDTQNQEPTPTEEATPTPAAQTQEPAPTEEATPTPAAQTQEPAPTEEATPTPAAQTQEPAPTEEATPTPAAQTQEPAPTEEATPTPAAQTQEPAPTEEATPTPAAQTQEPAPTEEATPTPAAQTQEPAPTEEATPTPAAQTQEPAPTEEATPTPDTQNQESAPTEEATPTPDTQNQKPAPPQEATPTPEAQSEDPPPAGEETKTLRSELTFSQTAWSADETDADGALNITVNINPLLTEASAVNITTAPNAAGDARVPTTLTLPAGQTSVELPITISGDDDAEGDESFDIELSAIPDAPYTLGGSAKTTITIIDDDRLDAQNQEPASAQEKTPTPEPQNLEPAPVQEETLPSEAQNQEPAPAQETMPTPAAQTQEPAPTQEATPTPAAQTQEPTPTQETTPTSEAQSEDPPPAQEETPTSDTKNQDPTPAQEESPTADTQNQDPASVQEETPTPEAQNQEPAPAGDATETIRPEFTFSQTAWSAHETDADGALTVTVKISPALTEASAVNITTSPNAAGDADVPATLALPAGQTSVDLAITISGDDDAEEDESFDIELSAIPDAPYALGEPATTAITIIDDDRPQLITVEAASAQGAAAAPQKEAESTPNAPHSQSDTQSATPQNQQSDGANSDPAPQSKLRLSQAAWSVGEAGGALDITVNIAPALPVTGTVNILTRYNGAATADDVSVPATLTLPQGATSATLRINITDDSLVEGDESFRIVLSASDNAPYKLGSRRLRRATITIIDDDRPQLTIVEAPSAQGAAAVPQKEAESPPSAPQLLSNNPGETRKTELEDDVNSDPDSRPKLSLSQAAWSVTEAGADGTLNVTVNISPALATASAINITTRYDSATAADVSVPATLTLPQGATSVELPITIRGDALVEGAESFAIELSAVESAPYTLGEQATAAITINDDDFATLTFEKAAYPANEWGRTLTIPVKINPALANASAVNITTRHISTAATDVSVPSTLTLPAGQTSVDLSITIREDALVEGAESFAIELSASAGAPYTLGGQATTTITINDNDRPDVSIVSPRQVRLRETNEDFTHDFTVKIEPALSITSTVKIVVDGNGRSTVRAPATLTLPKGATSAKLPLTIIGDNVHSGARRVGVKLSAIAGAPYKLHGQNALSGVEIWISDDDSRSPVLSFGSTSYTVDETDGDVTKNITVRLSNFSLYSAPRGYKITTRYGSATDDDVTVPTTFDLPAKGLIGTNAKVTNTGEYTFAITIHGDERVEGTEKLEIELSAVDNARYVLGWPVTATITIKDDDAATLALGQAAYTVNEGDGALNIPVKINPAMANASAVNITARYDTAAAADVSVPATLTLPAGQTSVALQIPITADNLVEGAEKLEIELSAVEGAPYTLGAQTKTAITIKDDDFATLAFSQAAWSATETDTDGTLNLNVSIAPALPTTSAVNITTRHISTAAADVSVPMTLPLPAGQTSVALPITIRGDSAIEGAEKLEIELSAVDGAPYTLGAQAKAAITINDDDFAALAFSQAAWSVTEADTDGTLKVNVSIAPALPITSTVTITPRYDSATAADVSVPATLTLPAGQTSVDLPITIRGDSAIEGAEKLEIELVAVEGARYTLGAQAKSAITINDDDFAALVFGQAAWSATEADTDGTLKVNVSIAPALPVTSTVTITTRYDSATAADVSVPATLTLPAGQTSVDLPITIRGDNAIEGAEKLEIELSAVDGAPYTLGQQAKTTITINDDDFATLTFEQAAYTVNEEDGALNIPVKINPALPTDSAVTITTRYDSATAADVSVPATLTLPAGQTSATLRVDITADTDIEGDETFSVALTASDNAPYTLGQPVTATITIKDDDQSSSTALALQRSAWTITVTPGDQQLDVSWQAPPRAKVSDIPEYWVTWCLEKEGWGCNPTARVVYPAVDGSGSYTITYHFSPGSDLSMVPLINGARYRVYVRAMQGHNTSLATSEFSYDNRPQASADNPEN